MINELRVTKFKSLNEFVSWTRNCPDKHGRGEWSGAGSYEEAVDIATKGINLGKVETEMKKLKHTRPEMQMEMDVAGAVINMDAYLTGIPENMFDFPIMEEATKFINVFIDVTEHAYVTANEMVNKAVAIASTIDDLENNGYRVAITIGNVICFDKSYNGHSVPGTTALATIIKIKDHHDVLSVGQITGCCHPSFLRMLLFRHYEYQFRFVGGTPKGIGRSASMTDIKTVLDENIEQGTTLIPNSRVAYGSLDTVQDAIEMINSYLK